MTPSTTLQDEQHLMSSMLTLLKQEQASLVDAHAEGVAEITLLKSDTITQLGDLARQRHAALASAGFDAAESGMEPWLAARGDATVRANWDQLLELTRSAKELNRVNGMLVARQLAHNQTVLNAMRTPAGGAGPAAPGLYGPGGQTAGFGPSRRFVVG
ncbi:MAG: flagellar protein FlgN [Pseudomonadota bacterium]|nr:flagellar protein FlgN [Pseudomonadota bacterium]